MYTKEFELQFLEKIKLCTEREVSSIVDRMVLSLMLPPNYLENLLAAAVAPILQVNLPISVCCSSE